MLTRNNIGGASGLVPTQFFGSRILHSFSSIVLAKSFSSHVFIATIITILLCHINIVHLCKSSLLCNRNARFSRYKSEYRPIACIPFATVYQKWTNVGNVISFILYASSYYHCHYVSTFISANVFSEAAPHCTDRILDLDGNCLGKRKVQMYVRFVAA